MKNKHLEERKGMFFEELRNICQDQIGRE